MSRAPRSLLAVLLLLVTTLTYRDLGQAGYLWDDDDYVVDNRLLEDLDGLATIWREPRASPQYYPLVFTSFWLEARVFGRGPAAAAGHHLVNLVLHGLSAVLVWLVLELLFSAPGPGPRPPPGVARPAAFLAALCFALHPIQVESVAWISERKNVLSGVFALGAVRAYLAFAPADLPLRERRWSRYALAAALMTCALLSKTVTATVPPALAIVLWWKGRLGRRDLLCLLPLLAIGVVAGLHTAYLEVDHAGSGGAFALDPPQRLLLAGRAPWFYLGQLLWPARFSFYYPRWPLDPASRAWSFPLATLALLFALWAWRRRSRGPLAAILIFGGTLFPVLGFLDIYPFRFSYVADHFCYLACLPVFALVSYGLVSGLRQRGAGTLAIALTLGLLAGALSLRTQRRARVFRDYETLLRDTLRQVPECWIAHANLAQLLASSPDPARQAEAFERFQRAAALEPRDARNRLNVGAALLVRARPRAALPHLQAAVRLKPDWARPWAYLLRCQRTLGDPAGAAETALRAWHLLPQEREHLAPLLGELRRALPPDAFELRRALAALQSPPD